MKEVKKAVILAAGLATRFLPLSKVMPKELVPLIDKPVIHYIFEEAKEAGVSQVVFVLSPNKKELLNYFKEDSGLEKILREGKRTQALKELLEIKELTKGISISAVIQEKPLGDGEAILKTKRKIGKDPFAVLFNDDIVETNPGALSQLISVFLTCERPVIALYPVPKEKVSLYGVCEVEKIANRFYKIKKIVEKPKPQEAPSNLAIVGKYVLLPEIFSYLETVSSYSTGEIILAHALDKMLDDGKVVYGYEIKGKWLPCGTKKDWLFSSFYFGLKYSPYKKEIREFIKKENLI